MKQEFAIVAYEKDTDKVTLVVNNVPLILETIIPALKKAGVTVDVYRFEAQPK